MGHDCLGSEAIYYGHFIDLTLIFDFKKFIEDINKFEDTTDVDYEYYKNYKGKFNSNRGLDDEQVDLVESSIKTSWEKYVKDNESLFEGINLKEMELCVFHQGYLACYEPLAMGNCKLVWGHKIGGHYNSSGDSNAPILKTNKPNNESGFEEHNLTMKFPKNSRIIFLNFLESIKMTETPKSEIKSFMRFGAYADIDTVWIDDEVEDKKRKLKQK